jgi:hypothetical protein
VKRRGLAIAVTDPYATQVKHMTRFKGPKVPKMTLHLEHGRLLFWHSHPMSRQWNGVTYKRLGAGREHVAIAERAIGKPLPMGAEVHHVDGNKRNNASANLVICQDHDYHMLLHARARIIRAGGQHGIHRICTRCREVLTLDSFYRWSGDKQFGLQYACKRCTDCGRTARKRAARSRLRAA